MGWFRLNRHDGVGISGIGRLGIVVWIAAVAATTSPSSPSPVARASVRVRGDGVGVEVEGRLVALCEIHLFVLLHHVALVGRMAGSLAEVA